jgi:hypothetical protein
MYYEIVVMTTTRNIPLSGSISVVVSFSVFDHKFDTLSFTAMEEVNLYIRPVCFYFKVSFWHVAFL